MIKHHLGPWLGVQIMQVSTFSSVLINRFYCNEEMKKNCCIYYLILKHSSYIKIFVHCIISSKFGSPAILLFHVILQNLLLPLTM